MVCAILSAFVIGSCTSIHATKKDTHCLPCKSSPGVHRHFSTPKFDKEPLIRQSHWIFCTFYAKFQFSEFLKFWTQETKAAAREKAVLVAEELWELKLTAAAKKVEEGIEETLTYMDYPSEHWNRIRTNNTTERVDREIKRRTKAIGAFPDSQSALMLVCCPVEPCSSNRMGIQEVPEYGPSV